MKFPAVHISELHKRLGFSDPILFPDVSLKKSLCDWRMENDDAPILKYLYRNFKPKRHLEFGTWQGYGATYCLEECDASVWTINIPFGEELSSGANAYGYNEHELHDILKWAERIGLPARPSTQKALIPLYSRWASNDAKKEQAAIRTDSLGFIGRKYLERDFGHRVCQIYCDSRKWDVANYTADFFDSVLIDGGHSCELVQNDTEKALKVLRTEGMILWHDFCPVEEVLNRCSSPRDVVKFWDANWDRLSRHMKDLFWINPSWILLGIKKE